MEKRGRHGGFSMGGQVSTVSLCEALHPLYVMSQWAFMHHGSGKADT